MRAQTKEVNKKSLKTYLSNIDANSVAKELKVSINSQVIGGLLIYLLIFIPLSYFPSQIIKPIWDYGLLILWAISFICGATYLIYSLHKKEANPIAYLICIMGFFIILYAFLILKIFGFEPAKGLIPIFIAGSMFFVGYAMVIIEDLLRYKTYLATLLNFIKKGFEFFILIQILYGIGLILVFIPQFKSFSSDNLPLLSLLFIQIGASYFFIKFARDYILNIKQNDNKNFSTETLVILVFTIVIETLNFFVNDSLNFHWIAVFALLTSLFYFAQTPSKRKSSYFIYIGYLVFIFFMVLNLLDIDIKEKFSWGKFIEYSLTILGIITGLWNFIKKKIFEKKGKLKIDKKEVIEASEEIIEKKGIDLDSVNDILNIAILSGNFDYCKELLTQMSQSKSYKHSKDLIDYFRYCLLCAEYTHKGNVKIEEKVEDEIISKKIVDEDEFKTHLSTIFPTEINKTEIWKSYLNNDYTRAYTDLTKIEDTKPIDLSYFFDKISNRVYHILPYFLLVVFLLNQLPFSFFSFLPSAFSHVNSWHRKRVTELRLNFFDAFNPIKDEKLKSHYAYNIYYWVADWEKLYGEYDEDNNVNRLSDSQINFSISWMLRILSFYENKNWLYYEINENTGNLYKLLKEYQSAIKYFNIALKDTAKTNGEKDIVLASMAECYLKTNDTATAFNLLDTIRNQTDFYKSKNLLAEIYFSKQKYNSVIGILEPMELSKIPPKGIINLGMAYFNVGEILKSKNFLEEIENKNYTYKLKPEEQFLYSLYLGRIYFAEQWYLNAANSFYTALLIKKESNFYFNSEMDSVRILSDFKIAIDSGSLVNNRDYRIKDWRKEYESFSP